MTRQTVDRILKAYPLGRRQPSAWQTVKLSRPNYGWAITFYDEYDRQVTCFGRARAEATLHDHQAQANYLLLRRAA
jgi:TnpA family transposase